MYYFCTHKNNLINKTMNGTQIGRKLKEFEPRDKLVKFRCTSATKLLIDELITSEKKRRKSSVYSVADLIQRALTELSNRTQ